MDHPGSYSSATASTTTTSKHTFGNASRAQKSSCSQMELTSNARRFLSTNPAAIGIEAASDKTRAIVVKGSEEQEVDVPLWQIETFAQEVLRT